MGASNSHPPSGEFKVVITRERNYGDLCGCLATENGQEVFLELSPTARAASQCFNDRFPEHIWRLVDQELVATWKANAMLPGLAACLFFPGTYFVFPMIYLCNKAEKMEFGIYRTLALINKHALMPRGAFITHRAETYGSGQGQHTVNWYEIDLVANYRAPGQLWTEKMESDFNTWVNRPVSVANGPAPCGCCKPPPIPTVSTVEDDPAFAARWAAVPGAAPNQGWGLMAGAPRDEDMQR